MVEKNRDTSKGARTTTKTSAPVKVSKATPITVKSRDLSPRALGLEILSRFFLGETDLDMNKRRVERYENRSISDEESVLSLLTEQMRNSEDLQQKVRIMEGIAEFQSSIGKDPRPVLGEMHKLELTIFKELGFEKVNITCRNDACVQCKAQDGKVIPVEEALSKALLPHQGCTRLPHGKARPFCRCHYYGEYFG